MMGTAFVEAAYKEFLPDCLCGNGEKAGNICIDEKCPFFKSLEDRLSTIAKNAWRNTMTIDPLVS